MDCMALEELVYGCTCACVMYVHFFFFSVLFYLSCHASERRFFFFLFKRVFPVFVFFSVSPIRTHSRSHCLLLLLLSANSSPFHSFLYTPLFFPTSFETHPRLPSLHQPGQSMSFTGILLQPLLMGDWDVCPLIGW